MLINQFLTDWILETEVVRLENLFFLELDSIIVQICRLGLDILICILILGGSSHAAFW